ncbi:hypothetical protein ACLB2K_072292 [Fragaria x ananassa]
MASELNLDMRSDGFMKVHDLLKLNLKTFANIPLSSHTVDEIKEAVRKDNKQRLSLLEENGELLIRANQGHSTTIVETERLLKLILSFEEVPGSFLRVLYSPTFFVFLVFIFCVAFGFDIRVWSEVHDKIACSLCKWPANRWRSDQR